MAERKWTDDQKNAIYARNGSLLISAAAGSGKTSVLVERIVQRLLDENDPCPPDGLLVVTFTNAAAAEMRMRIVNRLKELGADPAHRSAVRGLLPRMDEMTVGTMDAFCMELTRRNHAAVGVDPDFGVMEEGDERALKAAAAAALIEDAYESGDADFLALSRLFMRGRDDAELTNGIRYLSDFSMSEPDPARWLRDVAAHFAPVPAGESVWGRILLGRFADAAAYCEDLAAAALEDVSGDEKLDDKFHDLFILIGDRAADLKAAAEALDWTATGAALDRLYDALKTSFRAPTGYKDHPLKVAAGEKKNEMKDAVGRLYDLYPASEEEHREDIAALTPPARGLISAVLAFNGRLLAEKKALNQFAFSDIEHFAMELLCDTAAPDGKTELARELSDSIHEVLIDEFQDTNRLQDAIFTALSRGGKNLFVVGDVKQSIYRFRLASPELFLDRAAAYPLYTEKEEDPFAKIILGSNFRSRGGVTGAVNFVFRRLMSKSVGELDYTEDQWLYPAAKYPDREAPDVEFHLVTGDGRRSAAETAAAEADYIAALIGEKVASGVSVGQPGKERPARYGDFCILLRSAKGTAEVYADALRRRGIPVSLDAKDGFFETAEIRMAKSMLRAIDNPLRDIDLLAFLLSPVSGFTAERVAALRASFTVAAPRRKNAPLWNTLTAAAEAGEADAAAFTGLLLYYKRLCAAATAADVIGRIFDESTLLPAAAAMEEGYLRVANLRVLYETALKFSADGEKTLSSFVRYLERLEENGAGMPKGSAGSGGDRVQIMTAHRSKGLEFPFVILAGLTKAFNLRESSTTLFVTHEHGIAFKRREPEKLKFYETLSSAAFKSETRRATLSEELRIWYVAMTRAAENLIFVAAPNKWEEKIARIENLFGDADTLPPYYVLSCGAPIDWFFAALLRHPDLAALRQTSANATAADFGIRTVIAPPPPPPEAGTEGEAPADEALAAVLAERMRRTYAWAGLSETPALHTASHLRDEKFSPEFFGKAVPPFLLEGGMTPADVGTATHKFLQYVPFDPAPTDIAAAADALASVGRLTRQEAEAVNKASIAAFFASGFFRRIRESAVVHKEFSFNLMKSVRDFDPALPEAFADEKAVVIGKIDLVFEEDGKAVIVDYKTDRVKAVGELKTRYAGQLELYAEAVERVLGLRVKEKVLYSLTKGDFISWT